MRFRMEWKKSLEALLGSVILAFGMYQIHAQAQVTEGGVLGLELLLRHWFSVSPAVSSLVMNAACYLFGAAILGAEFVGYSIIAGLGYSLCYAVTERFPPLWPQIGQHPLLAALVGALFVGVGAGLCVRAGGAPGGDDALAMGLSKKLRVPIERVYLISDLTVLLLSLTYIPLRRIVWSLLTVVLSGQIIGMLQRFPGARKIRRKSEPPEEGNG